MISKGIIKLAKVKINAKIAFISAIIINKKVIDIITSFEIWITTKNWSNNELFDYNFSNLSHLDFKLYNCNFFYLKY